MDLLGNHVVGDLGVAFFVAIYSALRSHEVQPALLVLGDMTKTLQLLSEAPPA